VKLQDTHFDNAETGCCAKLDRALWDSRELEWNNKLFLRDHIRSFLHIPLNFGSVISRGNAAIEEAEAYPLHPVWLTYEVSPWGADVYVAVDREVPGKPIEKISGTFLTRVFEGPYRNMGQWMQEMEAWAQSKGKTVRRTLAFYATCPKCARHYGKNEVVLFAEVS
jgi:hypothetical protein